MVHSLSIKRRSRSGPAHAMGTSSQIHEWTDTEELRITNTEIGIKLHGQFKLYTNPERP